MTALLLLVFIGLCAFAVDVGRWYLVGQQEQRAADAAALAGVTRLPGDPTVANGAYEIAKSFSKANGFEHLPAATPNPTTVTSSLDRPTRLRVTVSRKVTNIFGSLLGVTYTTVARTAVADFGGPVPMGSPCNEFGNDPDPDPLFQGLSCSGVTSQMWASVASPGDQKQNGDAYQGKKCSSTADLCPGGGNNSEYNVNGYFYNVSVKTAGMTSLTIQLFDPVFVDVGLTCNASTTNPTVLTNFGDGSGTNRYATAAVNDFVPASDAATRYAPGATGNYCTGDTTLSGSQVMNTQFTVRHDSTQSLWDPSTFPIVDQANCQRTYPGYRGNLYKVLNKASTATYNKDSTGSSASPTIVDGFRRWTTLCTILNPEKGDYLIQVKSNVGGSFDNAAATNHFSIRAYGSDNTSLSVAGRGSMSMYSNKPSAVNEFYLARVPTGAAGQSLRVRLFDVGDSNTSGTIAINPPPDASGVTGNVFTGCQGAGPATGGSLTTNCSFPVIYANGNSDHQGKWQTVTVPIPSTYSCPDSDPTKCWVRLKYDYGGGKPNDITTWTAGVDGDPVRLVQ